MNEYLKNDEEESLADTLYKSIFKPTKEVGAPRETPHGFPLYSTKTPRYDIEQNKRTNYLNRLNLMSSSPTTHYYDKNGRIVKRTMRSAWEKKGYYFDPTGKMQRRSMFDRTDQTQKHGETIIAAKQLYEQQKDNKVLSQIEKGFLTHGTSFASRPEFNRDYAQLVSRGWNDPAAMRTMMSMGEDVDKDNEQRRLMSPIQPKSAEWKQLESAVITAANAAQSYFGDDPQRVREVVNMTENAFKAATPGNIKAILSSIDAKVGLWKAQATEERLKLSEQRDLEKEKIARRTAMFDRTRARNKESRARTEEMAQGDLLSDLVGVTDPKEIKSKVAAWKEKNPGRKAPWSKMSSTTGLGEGAKVDPNIQKTGDWLKSRVDNLIEATQRKATRKVDIKGEGKWEGGFDINSPHDQQMVGNLINTFRMRESWLEDLKKNPNRIKEFSNDLYAKIPNLVTGWKMPYLPGTPKEEEEKGKKKEPGKSLELPEFYQR